MPGRVFLPWALAFTANTWCQHGLTYYIVSANDSCFCICISSSLYIQGDIKGDAKFNRNRLKGFGGTEPPKCHFLYFTFIALTTMSALPCFAGSPENAGPDIDGPRKIQDLTLQDLTMAD